MTDEPQLRILPDQLAGDFGRMIGRGIIDQNNLEATGEIRNHFEQMMHLLAQRRLAIANRKDNTQGVVHRRQPFERALARSSADTRLKSTAGGRFPIAGCWNRTFPFVTGG